MQELTPEQAEQRETLIKLGHTHYMLDSGVIQPHEFGMLIQDTLEDDLFPDPADEMPDGDGETDDDDALERQRVD